MDPLLPEPALWEVHIAASRDNPPEKEWGEMIVRMHPYSCTPES